MVSCPQVLFLVSLGDASPVASTINFVDYNLDSLTVNWTESIDNDFFSYTLFRSYINGDPGEEIFTTNQKNITKYSFDNFDPNQLNWFSVVTKRYPWTRDKKQLHCK